MTRAFHTTGRKVLRIGGDDHRAFLQDLVTNDLRRLSAGAVYAALLTPQGKYLSDFLLVPDGETLLVDVAAEQAEDLARRLAAYKLRRKVTIEPTDLAVVQGFGNGAMPEGAFADPRDPGLGWRIYTADPQAVLDANEPALPSEWTALRVALAVPEAGIELIPNESYILEAGFDRLNGVDFRKGCYVGQEVTARMRHKTELRKGLARVRLDGPTPAPGTPILRDGKEVGVLHSTAADAGLAHLRFDRAGPGMVAGEAGVSLAEDVGSG